LAPNTGCEDVATTGSAETPNQINEAESSAELEETTAAGDTTAQAALRAPADKTSSLLALTSAAIKHVDQKKKA
jgi:hypothetical protein